MDFYEFRERRGERADSESERIAADVIGAAVEVHRALGPGHPEKLYESALCHELELQGISYQRQVRIAVLYKSKVVGESCIDLIVGGRVIVELKSIERFSDVHVAQALAYLAATKLVLALLINFNVPVLKQGIRRVVRDTQFAPS